MIINKEYYQPISVSYGVYDCNAIRTRELEVENYLKKFADNEIYYLDLATIINNLKILVSLQRDFYDRFYFDNINRTYSFCDDNSFLNFINKALAQYLEKVLENFDDLLSTDRAVASQYLENNITLLFELTNSQSSPIAKFGLQHHTVFSFNSHGNQAEVTFFSKIQNDNLSKLIDQRSRIINIQSELNYPDSLESVLHPDSAEKKSENSPSHSQLTIHEDTLKPFSCRHLFLSPQIDQSYPIAEDKIVTEGNQGHQSSANMDPTYISTNPGEIFDHYDPTQSGSNSSGNGTGNNGLEITSSPCQVFFDSELKSSISHVDDSSLAGNLHVNQDFTGQNSSFDSPKLSGTRVTADSKEGIKNDEEEGYVLEAIEEPIDPSAIEAKLFGVVQVPQKSIDPSAIEAKLIGVVQVPQKSIDPSAIEAKLFGVVQDVQVQ